MRYLILTIQLLFATVLLAQNNKQQPNILWIITDDQRADALACHNKAVFGHNESPLGYVSSPNLDALAKEGVLFTNSYCQSPGCAPSRASMHTGKYPHHSGIYGFEYSHNGPDFINPTLPQVMISKGYHTSRFGKLGVRIYKWQGEGKRKGETDFYQTIVDKSDLQKAGKTDYYGYSDWQKGKIIGSKEEWHFADETMKTYYRSRKGTSCTEEDNKTKAEIEEELDLLKAYTSANKELIIGGVSPQTANKTLDAYITESFKNYLNHPDKEYTSLDGNANKGPDTSKPQFIHLGYHFPHTPVIPPKSYRDKFKDKVYKVPSFSKEEVKKLPKQLQTLYNRMKVDDLSDDEKQQMIRDYYAFCAYGDALIGDAIAAFKKYCKKNNQDYLILMACGDHGWHLGEQGISAKFAPYKHSNHTAVIVASSDKIKFPPKMVITDYIEHVDFAPTFISAAGDDVNTPQYNYLDGYDLAEVVNGKKPVREYVLGEQNQIAGDRAYIRCKDFAFSMRARKQPGKPTEKDVLANANWPLICARDDAEMALFDLRIDALEQNNVANDPEYIKLADWFRKKLGDIVLGDGRIEVAWNKENIWKVSDFAKGADNKKMDIPAGIIPSVR
ncbi:sulfatase-like hydrolase/transferase [Saccharicrinis aurantiacus]|uniref:sulfatase-like hydrolase/transferase n=1 Tax=Saccharicrinis aurantiacus TaxID=1849719 RepID=UPI0024929E3B|nr:sulfatase-like hydrolase/transferase [Saccharicrinis aurantiacus]